MNGAWERVGPFVSSWEQGGVPRGTDVSEARGPQLHGVADRHGRRGQRRSAQDVAPLHTAEKVARVRAVETVSQ